MDKCTATTTVPGHPGRLARCSLGVGHEGKHTKGDILWEQKPHLEADKGWWFPSSRKAHWADPDGRSLCLRWAAFGVPAAAFENDGGTRTSPDECRECRRRLDKRRGANA